MIPKNDIWEERGIECRSAVDVTNIECSRENAP